MPRSLHRVLLEELPHEVVGRQPLRRLAQQRQRRLARPGVAATLDDATSLMSIYINGALSAQTTTDVRPFATLPSSGSPGVGIGNANGTSTNDPFNGQIDELSVYNRALTAGEILGIYKAGSSGKVSSPIAVSNPSVVEGPAGTTQAETFTITRTGSTTRARWSRNPLGAALLRH